MLTLLNEYIIIKGYFELLNKVKRVCKYEITCFYNLYGYVVAYIFNLLQYTLIYLTCIKYYISHVLTIINNK